ncbi:glycine--tRNA ligase subunit beta [Asticcacaulis solisilvae]|uniref:glycine--tRNA ligase subunit beta n=1 Tax=Asticcacaulis solisilvae TaxID=1217274 RepID=UPI003FD8CB04
MAELLIELFSEEIPARMQLGAARDFERLMGGKLAAAGLEPASIKAYVSPRRLALVVDGLPVDQPATSEEVKGPKDGAPEQAMAGFLRKVGLTQDQLTLENGVWMARIEKPGRKTVDVLALMLNDVILGFPWPKSMRSGTSTFRWVRPLKRILFLFDGNVVPFELEGLTASNCTEGHRFLGSGKPFQVKDFAGYKQGLLENSVILDHSDRQAVILEKARAACAAAGCELMDDQGLLEEVAGLNEWPVPVLGDMDPQFLTLPPEVIKTSMRTHQKYFAVRDAKSGKMAPHFVIVANMVATDGGTEIKRGNAKVLSARLSDGIFFWTEDNKPGKGLDNFDNWLKRLEGTTFHIKLGTMAQRVERIVALSRHIAPFVNAPAEVAAEAARLAKADLASKMVGEFPELQGIMGGYYADAAGLDPVVANAVREHYKPQGPSDSVPESPVSAAVALADKIDTLVGFFAIDEKPTGSKDPYALRRAALGTLRILREHNARVSIGELVQAWYAHLGGVPEHFKPYETVRTEILDFFVDRIKVQLKDEGQRFDIIDAVLANSDDDVVRVTLKCAALDTALLLNPEGEDMMAGYKRASNILAAEAKKGALPSGEPVAQPDAPGVESDLIAELRVQKAAANAALAQENYLEALKCLAALRQNVDAFLDGVLVNAEDPDVRANRLRILAEVAALAAPVADLGKVV